MSEIRTRINVVLFSGGSGTHSITEAVLRHPQIRLRILINAYDDGHSTGRLRKFIPGMLGPSDVRKNISRLMPQTERCHKSMQLLSDYRLPVGISRADALALLDAIAEGDRGRLPATLADAFRMLSLAQAEEYRSLIATFLAFFHEEEKAGRHFDFTDCALGNILFAGCFLQNGCDFNRTIRAFSRFYEVPEDTLLNITQGESLFLVAEKEDGSMLLAEGDIVAAQSAAKISNLYLIDEHTYRASVENAIAPPAGGWLSLVQRAGVTPEVNPEAVQAIAEADLIIYGPGTQHSSLFPSYMTRKVAEAIAANKVADKIFIGNIVRDHDIQEDNINDLARKFMHAMTRNEKVAVEWTDCVTHFFVQNTQAGDSERQAQYIPFDPTKFMYALDTVRVRDWEVSEGRHAGGYVLNELREIVQSRIDIELQGIQHMVSIIVPVLNEGSTLEEVLKSLLVLDFHPLGITKELIVVDGGSTDKSREIAQSVRTVRYYETAPGAGRGAALKLGIEKARGSMIAFFPADREYRTEDLFTLVRSLAQSKYLAVFGTRAVKVRDLSEQLKTIYGNNKRLYFTSKYGGILLSITTLLLYNRYITDVLTSVKAFDGPLLKSLRLDTVGRNLDTEIFAKLAMNHVYILELPVDYSPRTRAQGKKITMGDGLQSLLTLFRCRFQKEQPIARIESKSGRRK